MLVARRRRSLTFPPPVAAHPRMESTPAGCGSPHNPSLTPYVKRLRKHKKNTRAQLTVRVYALSPTFYALKYLKRPGTPGCAHGRGHLGRRWPGRSLSESDAQRNYSDI